MKMTKSQFKTLMKECLSELINEGAFDKKLEQIAESKMTPGGSTPRYSGYGSINEETRQSGGINPRILDAINEVTRGKQGAQKNMFRDIMMDTAMTSLQSQLEGAAGLQENVPATRAEIATQEAELSALAGGNPSRWAMAAFGGKQKP